MKRLLLVLLATVNTLAAFAQPKTTAFGIFDFDGTWINTQIALYRDTASNPNCIWQVGSPHKMLLNSAQSLPNVIVTDTLNAYPVNDVSSFVIQQRSWAGWFPNAGANISGWYRVDSDSLTDYGSIEISIDKGSNWINILDDTLYGFFDSSQFFAVQRPVLTGDSGGWRFFGISFEGLTDSFNIQPGADTILMRFSFISDSIQTNKGGLMYDDILVYDWMYSVNDVNKLLDSRAFPNPVISSLNIRPSENYVAKIIDLLIIDAAGKVVYSGRHRPIPEIRINTAAFSPGMYRYRLIYDSGRFISTGSFIKN